MTDWVPFPLPDGSYSDSDRPWTQQDVVGFLPTVAEQKGARSPVKFMPCPGLQSFVQAGTGPFRGSHDVEGRCFNVVGTQLVQVKANGALSGLGVIPGTGLVSMAHNQIDNGNQLLIATGNNSYLFNTATQILAATGIPLLSVDFLNQRFLGVDRQRRFWRYSDLANGDSTAWNTLNNESAESSPDRIVGGKVSQGVWWVFGERTIEPWANNVLENSAFQRGPVIEKGCANANTICRLDNTLFWLGNDMVPYRLNGYTPIPIAPKALIDEFTLCDPDKAFSYTYEENGYVVWYLTFQDGRTWGYDVTNRRWHRRESYGLDRWRINTLFKWNDRWWAGDYSNGLMYRLKWGVVKEGGVIFPRRIRTGVTHNAENRIAVHALRLLANTGKAEDAEDIFIDLPLPELSGDPDDALVGDDYSYTLTASGGSGGGYVFVLNNGTSLPSGWALSASGEITKTGVTDIPDFSFSVRLTDSAGSSVVGTFTIAVLSIDDVIAADAPVLWWKLNEPAESTEVIDYSGNDYTGAYVGIEDTDYTLSDSGITMLRAGAPGAGNPNSGVKADDDIGDLNIAGNGYQWAYEIVLTRAGTGTGFGDLAEILGILNPGIAVGHHQYKFGHFAPNQELSATQEFSGGATGVQSATGVLPVAQKTHILVSCAESPTGTGTVRMYINGALAVTGTPSTQKGPIGSPSYFSVFALWSGDGGYSPLSWFNGKGYYCALYDKTLTVTDALRRAKAHGCV